ncbi:MAG: DUF4349 domain-containing protein [Lachnospiraceae bacterium]|nr:DUF4349 domain-containing protein [Lachnospiraceae bacterium]
MKTNRRLLVLLTAMILSVSMLLTGCGGNSKDSAAAVESGYYYTEESIENYYYDNSGKEYIVTASSAGNYETETTVAPGETETAIPQDAKLIYTARFEVETVEYDTTVDAIKALVNSEQGYFENSDTWDYGGYRNCSYTIRIPKENYRNFIAQAESLQMVISFSESVENVTSEYFDVQTRLESARRELEAYQALYEQAVDMEDILSITRAINEIQTTIDVLSGTIRNYDQLVGYSTIHMSVTEVSRLRGQDPAPIGFGERMVHAFKSGWTNLVDDTQDFLVSLAYDWFGTLIFLVLVIVGILHIRKAVKKNKAKKAAYTAYQVQLKQSAQQGGMPGGMNPAPAQMQPVQTFPAREDSDQAGNA